VILFLRADNDRNAIMPVKQLSGRRVSWLLSRFSDVKFVNWQTDIGTCVNDVLLICNDFRLSVSFVSDNSWFSSWVKTLSFILHVVSFVYDSICSKLLVISDSSKWSSWAKTVLFNLYVVSFLSNKSWISFCSDMLLFILHVPQSTLSCWVFGCWQLHISGHLTACVAANIRTIEDQLMIHVPWSFDQLDDIAARPRNKHSLIICL